MNTKRTFLLIVLALSVSSMVAQTNGVSVANVPAVSTNQAASLAARTDEIRTACIQGRRSICGKILKVLPAGLVVESGYTNLMRSPLDQSWLVPGTATASLAPNLVEGNEPGSVCVGLVFLTDIPRSRGVKPRQYDYVVIQGYPAGQYTYNSLGTIERTVRRFSAGLPTAIDLCLEAEKKKTTPATEVK